MDESAFKALISGERRGVFPALQRGGLSALSLLYGLAVRLRNRAFDHGWLKSHHADVPVVSVGNITTGGTGKTPLVAWLANRLSERGVRVAILSRGYRGLESGGGKRKAESGKRNLPVATYHNDEKLVLDRLCPGVPHVQRPDRVAGAKIGIEQHGAQLLILDDGFQHRRLGRDLDIVLIDALNPFGYGRLLPRGLLREPLSSLSRADVIVLTRADQCPDTEKSRILQTVRPHAPECPVVEVAFRPAGLINAEGETDEALSVDLSSLHGKPIIGFCGIGNPESFRRMIAGCDVRAFRTFPDHHHYAEADLDELAQLAAMHKAAALLTTLKDLVKIDRGEIACRPLRAVQIVPEFLSGADALQQRLTDVLHGIRADGSVARNQPIR